MSNHISGAQQTAPPQNSSTSARGPFASALRNLAKQADIKEDESNSGGDNVRSGSTQRTSNVDGRSGESRQNINDGRQTSDDRSGNVKKRTLSPQPPEKVNIWQHFSGTNETQFLFIIDGSLKWPS